MAKIARVPSVHLKKTELGTVLTKVFKIHNIKCKNMGMLVNSFMNFAHIYTCNNRKLLVSNPEIAKKALKQAQSPKDDTHRLANELQLTRKRLKHRGITLITPNSRDWLILKTLTTLANEFCEEFGLVKKEGYRKYWELVIANIKPFALQRVQSNHLKLVNIYTAVQLIENDLDKNVTLMGYDIYQKEVANQTGIVENLRGSPLLYQYFVQAKDIAMGMGVTIEDYIKAQFEGLSWANAIPTPKQLIGDISKERVKTYMRKHGKKALPGNTKVRMVDWKTIKKQK